MINKINALLKEVENLKAANAEDKLEALRIKYLSKKGEISLLINHHCGQQHHESFDPF